MNHTLVRPFAAAFVLLVAIVFAPTPGTAQFGFGAGVAAVGDDFLEAGVNLTRFVDGDTLQYSEIGGVLGGYVIGHFRYGYGHFMRLNLDVGYAFFPAENIKLVEVNAETNEALFEVGASLIPIALGTEVVLPNDNIRPYLGAQVTYTVFNRTYAYVQGNEAFNREDIRTDWAGRDRWGVAFRTGCEFAIGDVALDVGLRYNLANLISKNEGEKGMNYLQVGLNLLFGELMNTREEDKAKNQ
ncbi:MAG: outer membrane beta-barrel protein [bacterium]|nr:outer membrane beta-barrel protein [Candidatus Kapabacteria bacterium]